jgi:hypothetical protein
MERCRIGTFPSLIASRLALVARGRAVRRVPERQGQWELLDRASDPVVADTAAIGDQLTHFRELAEMLRVQGDRLTRIGSGDSLRGAYADELRSSATEVGKDLTQTVGRYEAVVTALQEYRPAIDAALSGSASALDDAIDAAGAQGRAGALTEVRPTGDTPLTPEQEQANLDRTAAVEGAAARLQEAKAKLGGLLQRLDEAGRAAARTVSRGFDDGLKDSHWDRFKHGFVKFLKILIKVFTIVAMALAVIALVIPGVGPVISAALLAASRALDVALVVAEVVLVALDESSPEDIAFAILGLVTLGAGAFAKGARKAAPARGADDETIPLVDRSSTPEPDTPASPSDTSSTGSRPPSPDADAPPSRPDTPPPARSDTSPRPSQAEMTWGVPPGSKLVDPPNDLPDGMTIKPGTQTWESPTGVKYTRIESFQGYRGMRTEWAEDFYANGPRRGDDSKYPDGNGHTEAEWKALYIANSKGGAKGYAKSVDFDTAEAFSGDLVRFDFPNEFTLVTPNQQLDKNPSEFFPDLPPGSPNFVDRLGENNMILRNPLDPKFSDDNYEFAVPWSMAPQANVTPVGRWVPRPYPLANDTRPIFEHDYVDL